MGDVRFGKFEEIEARLPSPGKPLSEVEEAPGMQHRSPCISLSLDQDGKLKTVSQSYEKLTGFQTTDVIGKNFFEIISVEDAIGTTLEIDRLLNGSDGQGSHWAGLLRKSGGPIPVFMNLIPVTDSTTVRNINVTIWRANEYLRSESDLAPMMGLRGPDRSAIGAIGYEREVELGKQLEEGGVDILDRDLEALVETSKDIVESDDLVDAIDKDLGKFIDFLGVDFGVFRLMGEGAKPRMVCAGIDFKKGRKVLEMRLVGEGALHRDIQAGKTFISMDIQGDPRIVAEEHDIRSVACLPVKFRSEVFGAACFGSKVIDSNLQSKLPILQVFCNQVALSLRKARLKGELQLRNKELETLYETAMALAGSLDFNLVLETMLKKASELVKADNVHMFRLDRKKNVLVCVSSICEFHDSVMGLELKLGEGITGIVAQSGKGMLIERADKDERSMQIPGTPEDPSSLISVPLKMGEEILGVITLERVPGIPFNKSDFRLIEMFSVMAATAVNNAQLYNKINEHAASQQMYTILLTHDVANYNVPIHGYLEMLAKDPKLDERQRRYILSALAQSENISSLISDVRKLALLRTTQDAEQPVETIDLTVIMKDCIESLRMNTLYEGISLNYSPPMEDALVAGDTFVKDIVYNLLSNACKYGGSGPVEIEIYPHVVDSYDYWRLDVKDQGEGVPEDRRAFLFKRFDNFNAESASEGHGIGLSVVTMLVERLGGKVWVDDREKIDQVKGSVFSVIFPRARLNIDD